MFVAAVLISSLVAAAVAAGLVYFVHARLQAKLPKDKDIKALVDRRTAPILTQLEESRQQTEEALASLIADFQDTEYAWKTKIVTLQSKATQRLDILHRAVCEIQKTRQQWDPSKHFVTVAERLAQMTRQIELLTKRVVAAEGRASKSLRRDDLGAIEREIGDSRARIAKLENDLRASINQGENERQVIDGRLANLRDKLAGLAAEQPNCSEALSSLRSDLHADLAEFSTRTDGLERAVHNVSAGLKAKVETCVAQQLETLADRVDALDAETGAPAHPDDERMAYDELQEPAWTVEDSANGKHARIQHSAPEGAISLPRGLITVMAEHPASRNAEGQVGHRDCVATDDDERLDYRDWMERLDTTSV